MSRPVSGRAASTPRATEILSVGMVTPIGLCAAQAAAAHRTGITGLRESYVHDRFVEPLVMGLVEETALPALVEPLAATRIAVPRRRLLRMAGAALDEALGELREPVPLLLGCAEARKNAAVAVDVAFLEQLATQSGRALDLSSSRAVACGRAAGLVALAEAADLIGRGVKDLVLVGGADSYLDEVWLAELDREGRLHNGELPDGFVPGEGAAFVLLAGAGAAARRGWTPLAHVASVGLGREPGNRSTDIPCLGDGLTQAFADALRAPAAGGVRGLYTGMNGESFWAKELGAAQLRHGAHFAEPLRIDHPADAVGDLGAAAGPTMLALAAWTLRSGYREGPILVTCSSDGEERAAVLLSS